MKEEPKFGIGDKVKIVKYGSLYHAHKDGKLVVGDWAPQIVGKTGIVSEVDTEVGKPMYAIHGIEEKIAWYNEDQMEMVKRNPNR